MFGFDPVDRRLKLVILGADPGIGQAAAYTTVI